MLCSDIYGLGLRHSDPMIDFKTLEPLNPYLGRRQAPGNPRRRRRSQKPTNEQHEESDYPQGSEGVQSLSLGYPVFWITVWGLGFLGFWGSG